MLRISYIKNIYKINDQNIFNDILKSKGTKEVNECLEAIHKPCM